MNLDFAVDRLYDSGWFPVFSEERYEELGDGRQFPSVEAIRREFTRLGLQLAIKHNLIYNCHRATWAPIGETIDASTQADERHGNVIGSSEQEAAVYALAQLREMSGAAQMALA
jgi:hypothetical protein